MAEQTKQFSFVWFNFGIIVVCGIFWVLFLGVVYANLDKVKKGHDTISSYCAQSEKWENRFLLTFTILISMNLLCMFTEEYNSRNQESRYFWIFMLECTAAAVFPLVGICYTEGKKIDIEQSSDHQLLLDLTEFDNKNDIDNDDNAPDEIDMRIERAWTEIEPVNDSLECGKKQIPISVSSKIHDFAAFYFFVVLTFTNSYYVIHLWSPNEHHQHDHTFGSYVCLIFLILNLVLFIGYLLIAIMIGLRKKKSIFVCFNVKHETLRVCNFGFEALLGLVIVALAIISSMKRNDDVSFFN